MSHRCYTSEVPTKRRRHAITETPPVAQALDELRAHLGTDSVELAELVVLGARAKLDTIRADHDETNRLRARLAERVRAGDLPVDRRAADEVRRVGWAR